MTLQSKGPAFTGRALQSVRLGESEPLQHSAPRTRPQLPPAAVAHYAEARELSGASAHAALALAAHYSLTGSVL